MTKYFYVQGGTEQLKDYVSVDTKVSEELDEHILVFNVDYVNELGGMNTITFSVKPEELLDLVKRSTVEAVSFMARKEIERLDAKYPDLAGEEKE